MLYVTTYFSAPMIIALFRPTDQGFSLGRLIGKGGTFTGVHIDCESSILGVLYTISFY